MRLGLVLVSLPVLAHTTVIGVVIVLLQFVSALVVPIPSVVFFEAASAVTGVLELVVIVVVIVAAPNAIAVAVSISALPDKLALVAVLVEREVLAVVVATPIPVRSAVAVLVVRIPELADHVAIVARALVVAVIVVASHDLLPLVVKVLPVVVARAISTALDSEPAVVHVGPVVVAELSVLVLLVLITAPDAVVLVVHLNRIEVAAVRSGVGVIHISRAQLDHRPLPEHVTPLEITVCGGRVV